MGGMNENWLILHNRFRVEKGDGAAAKTSSFDHILRGNVFLLRDPKATMVRLATPDCTGVEILDNQVYGGNGQFVTGAAQRAECDVILEIVPPERDGLRVLDAIEESRVAWDRAE